MKKHPTPEWHFPVAVDDIGNAPAHYTVTADEKSCATLAERFDVLGLENLVADVTLTREQGGRMIHVAGTVEADVRQTCVITLDPMVSHVRGDIDAYYADPAQAVSFARARAVVKAKKGEVEVEMIDERDAPEEIVDGIIDLGEVAAQFLSLAIDPYPRSVEDLEEVKVPDCAALARDDDAPEKENPFAAALRGWKDGLKS